MPLRMLFTTRDKLWERLDTWQTARNATAARVALDALVNARERLSVHLCLAHVELCKFAVQTKHPRLEVLLSVPTGFDAISPEKLKEVQARLLADGQRMQDTAQKIKQSKQLVVDEALGRLVEKL